MVNALCIFLQKVLELILDSNPRFASSNLTEVDGFFQNVKLLSTSPPGGTLSGWTQF